MSTIVEVAAAVMLRAEGREFLLAQRPEGKVYAGYWEFPGGKLETGETVRQALIRELQEELGITVTACSPWLTRVFTYPHATVRLNFWRVTAWEGEIGITAPLEHSAFDWLPIGQPATVISDIYGDDVKYTGKVVGLDMGTGSAFSLLPAQNATGNWIKVVQRLPVRIELDAKQLADHPLRIGLSTLVTVDTANRDGQILASQVRSSPVYESNAREISLDPVNKLIDDIVKANAG